MLITIKIYNQPRKFLKSEKLLATFWATVELCGLEIGNLEPLLCYTGSHTHVFSMYMIQYHITSPTFIPQRKTPTWNVVCVVDWVKVKDFWLETKQNLERGSGSGSNGLIEYGSNTDPDPKPWRVFCGCVGSSVGERVIVATLMATYILGNCWRYFLEQLES